MSRGTAHARVGLGHMHLEPGTSPGAASQRSPGRTAHSGPDVPPLIARPIHHAHEEMSTVRGGRAPLRLAVDADPQPLSTSLRVREFPIVEAGFQPAGRGGGP